MGIYIKLSRLNKPEQQKSSEHSVCKLLKARYIMSVHQLKIAICR